MRHLALQIIISIITIRFTDTAGVWKDLVVPRGGSVSLRSLDYRLLSRREDAEGSVLEGVC